MIKTLARLVLLAALISCGADKPLVPDPFDPDSVEGQILALFPEVSNGQHAAMGQWSGVRAGLEQGGLENARSQSLTLVDFIFTELSKGRLNGGKIESTRAAASRLVDAIYLYMDLPAPHVPDAALTDDGAARIVRVESDETVLVPNGDAGLTIFAHTLPANVLVTIVRVPNPATPGTGSLPTELKQYPAYYDISVTPAVILSDFARVGICPLTNASDPFYPPAPRNQLRLAHAVFSASSPGIPAPPIEILEPVAVNNLTPHCAPVTPGLGGRVKSFGRFGTVVP